MKYDVQSRLVAPGCRNYTEAPNWPESRLASELERFGGMKGRYRRGNYKELRAENPFTGRLVFFPKRPNLQNWLLRAFTPSVHTCRVPDAPLRALRAGRVIKAKPSLLMVKDKDHIADFVAPQTEALPDLWEDFQIVARAHGYEPVLRTVEEIRSQPTLLRNLGDWRRHLVLHMDKRDRAQLLVPLIEGLVANKCVSIVGDLYWELLTRVSGVAPETIDSAIILTYLAGRINLNISEVSYDADTQIQLL